jgi:NMD protein affecting ribosome stability and mRNA decay
MNLQTAEIAQIRPESGFSPGNQKHDQQFRPFRQSREGNSRPDPRQRALFCRCGALPPLTRGLCTSCYWKWRHSLRFYGGQPEEVLERDGDRCRACGSERWVGIHHRRPGDNRPSFLITICAACHAQVYRLLSIWKWVPALLAELWAEQPPGAPVQLQIELTGELNFGGRKVTAVERVP